MNPYITAYAVAGDAVAATMPEALTSGITEAVSLVGTAFSAITSNTVLCVFLGAALVKVGMSIFRSMKYYPGGVEICGAEKILPDLYFCDGQAIMSMKLTEGST